MSILKCDHFPSLFQSLMNQPAYFLHLSSGYALLQKPNSWTDNFVEFNIESSETWGFRYTMFTLQTSFKPLLLKGGGGVKSV
jgi:hypothetical protein